MDKESKITKEDKERVRDLIEKEVEVSKFIRDMKLGAFGHVLKERVQCDLADVIVSYLTSDHEAHIKTTTELTDMYYRGLINRGISGKDAKEMTCAYVTTL